MTEKINYVEAFNELLGQELCPPLDCSTLSSMKNFQLHLFLKKTEWFKKAITVYIAAKKAGAFERFFQRHQEDPSPSLDVFQKLLKSAKFNELRDQFFEPQEDCVPLSCPLTGEILTEPWRNKYGRVFQKSQQYPLGFYFCNLIFYFHLCNRNPTANN